MNGIWREEKGLVHYIPTNDGEFERWMDENDSMWTSANGGSIEFWRAIWQAGYVHGKKIKPITLPFARWDIVLTSDEIKLLAKGFDPRLIQPDHLIEYRPVVTSD